MTQQVAFPHRKKDFEPARVGDAAGWQPDCPRASWFDSDGLNGTSGISRWCGTDHALSRQPNRADNTRWKHWQLVTVDTQRTGLGPGGIQLGFVLGKTCHHRIDHDLGVGIKIEPKGFIGQLANKVESDQVDLQQFEIFGYQTYFQVVMELWNL